MEITSMRRKTGSQNRRRQRACKRPMVETLEDRRLLSGLNLLSSSFYGTNADEIGTGLAVIDTGSQYEAFGTGRSSTQGGDGVLVNYHVPYNLQSATLDWGKPWPNAAGGDDLSGVAATGTAVYTAGRSWSQTNDMKGDKEGKGITVSFAPGNGSVNWAKQTPAAPGAWSYSGIETAFDVASAVEGNQTYLYVTGTGQSGGLSLGRLWVSKLDTNGNILWTQKESDGNPTIQGNQIIADGSNVYIAGYSNQSGSSQGYLRKHDANGNLQWTNISVAGQFNGLAQDTTNGFLYAVGQTNAPNANFLVEKWDLAGNKIWSQTFDRASAEDILNGVTLWNGQLYAVGSTRGNTSGGSDGVVLHIDVATGALLDTSLWGGAVDDSFDSVSAAGGLHVLGSTRSFGAGGSDIAYLTYDQIDPFIVTTTADAGPGSLRQAIINSNNNPGTDTITFNISGTGVHTISPESPLPTITDPVIINGYSQPGASPNTLAVGNSANLSIELNGAGAGSSASGLVINAGNSTVKGLVINRFSKFGIDMYDKSQNAIEGNFIGTDPSGLVSLGNGVGEIGAGYAGISVRLGSLANTIGGTTTAARNLISGNGSGIELTNTNSNFIQGNYVGTDRHGSADLGNGSDGIYLGSTQGNTIGGLDVLSRNVVSGNDRHGIDLYYSPTTANVIQGNYIGTSASGTNAIPNAETGISLTGGAYGNEIGGLVAAAGNVIAHNTIGGVVIESGTGNAIRRNSIFANGGLGIDLGNDNVTTNDFQDTDTGANNLQNFPVLNTAFSTASATVVRGALNSTPNTVFIIEFFLSEAADPTGHGEGQTYLGTRVVTTNADGNVNVPFRIMSPVPVGYVISATATDPDGNTSEFGPAVTVGEGPGNIPPPSGPSHTPATEHAVPSLPTSAPPLRGSESFSAAAVDTIAPPAVSIAHRASNTLSAMDWLDLAMSDPLMLDLVASHTSA